MSTDPAAKNETKELRGSVLDVLRDLLGDHASTPAVIKVVAKLVSRNQELEMLLATMRTSGQYERPQERARIEGAARSLPRQAPLRIRERARASQ